jgi:cytochrome c peroxidase
MSKAFRGLRLGDCSESVRSIRWFIALPAAALLGVALWTSRQNEPVDAPHAAGLGNADALAVAYENWLPTYTEYAESGDVLVLGLNFVKGLSTEHTSAAGSFHLDLKSGSLDAEIKGLPEASTYELWLVDNRESGGGSGARADAGDDRLQWVGEFAPTGEYARLSTHVDVVALADFDLDMVVVAPAGRSVGDGLIFGTPSLFQRMYHEQRGAGFGPRADVDGENGNADLALATLLPPAPVAPQQSLVGLGEFLFFKETFGGNGRTCGTCHPADNNLTIDPEFIGGLEDDDPLFVAENNPALAGLENPKLMRELGLILENVDGFDKPGVMRGVPHILAMSQSMTPAAGGFDGTPVPPLQRTGWSGDGAPGGGTLREFAIGAVTQHFTKRLNRVAGIDFRLPTENELDALEAFQLSLGRQSTPDLSAISMKNPIAEEGRRLFLKETTSPGAQPAAKCTSCHNNGGANASPLFLSSNAFPAGQFNLNLNIGSSLLSPSLAEVVDPGNVPVDGGFGKDPHVSLGGFGSHAFNVASLLEAPDTAPYFHDNSALTLENAITFYLGGEFNASPAAALMNTVDNPPGFGVMLMNMSDVQAVATFLRVANAALNAASARSLMQRLKTSAVQFDEATRERVFKSALSEIDDARFVLKAIHIHSDAIAKLDEAYDRLKSSQATVPSKIDQAINLVRGVPALLID